MAELVATAASVDADAQADSDFSAGFTLDSPPAEIPAPIEPASKPESVADPAPEVPVTAEVAQPKHVQLTQEQFDSLQANATKTAAIEAQLSKVFGTMGDMQQVVRKLQTATPAGMSIEIPKDAFTDMEKDFPELATLTRTGLEKALKGIRGTGANAAETPDPESIQRLISAAIAKREVTMLTDTHPNWREIVGAVETPGTHNTENGFRKWLATKDAAYQHKINATESARVIAEAIDKFETETAARPRPAPNPAPKIAARADRIREAIQPKGDGKQPAPSKTADDDFNEGYRERFRTG